MRTKLVYVLTCAENATYIEQSLISIWSARYHNPNAHIVLIVDDLTNQLLIGKRAEVLEYVTKKVVIPFEDTNANMIYRSRFIKTQVRQVVKGDFLFIDCDTIITHSLDKVDEFDCEIGAVLESHLKVNQFCAALYQSTKDALSLVGLDIDKEQYYFSSGVLYVRDTACAHRLYQLWHQYWLDGNQKGLKIDQPALAKANKTNGYVIKQIPDTYNCILFTQPPFLRSSFILHIAAYNNPSFLFTDKVLNYVRENGLNNLWLQKLIINPFATMMPFDYNLKHSSICERKQWIRELSSAWGEYKQYIDNTCIDFPNNVRMYQLIVFLLCRNYINLAIWIYIFEARIHLYRKPIKYNLCQK